MTLLQIAVVAGVFLIMAGLLLITAYRLGKANLRILDLEQAYPERKRNLRQRKNELAHVKALRDRAIETELFARLSLEMGFPAPGEEDDTLPLIEELP